MRLQRTFFATFSICFFAATSVFASPSRTSSFVGSLGRFAKPGTSQALPGKYLRQQITDSSSYPLRAMGRIETRSKSQGVGTCSATLVGSRYLLTAAHCVYNLETRAFVSDIKFFPGQTAKNVMPFDPVDWERVYIPSAYMNSAETGAKKSAATYAYDYAIIVLKAKVGESLGWVRMQQADSATVSQVNVAGYPGDKPVATYWSVSCPMERRDSQWFMQCDGFQGMSGSSLRVPQADGKESVIGVFDWGQDDVPGQENYNGGVVFTAEVFAQLAGWVKDTPDTKTATNENNRPQATGVYVRNSCMGVEKAQVAVRYLTDDNQWVESAQWIDIPAGKTIRVATLWPGVKNYYFTGRAGEFVWKGDSLAYIQGQPQYMMKVELTDSDLQQGIEVRTLTCSP